MTVTGLFVNINHARDAVQDLIRAGFDAEAINFVARHEAGDSDSATHDAESGALYGGGIGLLIGLSALTVPGVGAIVAAGAIVTALAGAGLGAAGGFLVHALQHIGVGEEEARRYSTEIEQGGTLVAVEATDETIDRATRIMRSHEAIDVDNRSTQ